MVIFRTTAVLCLMTNTIFETNLTDCRSGLRFNIRSDLYLFASWLMPDDVSLVMSAMFIWSFSLALIQSVYHHIKHIN